MGHMAKKNVLLYVPNELFDTDQDTRPGSPNLNMWSIAFFALTNGVNASNYYRLDSEQLKTLGDIEWKLLTEFVPGQY